MQGTRVNSIDAIWEGNPGDYFPIVEDGICTALWFKLPTGTLGRIAADGHGKHGEPEWTITVNADETVTVDPSIEQHETTNVPYWHGHLVNGVWS